MFEEAVLPAPSGLSPDSFISAFFNGNSEKERTEI
jgi:hypothetical protein